jgi:tetratricopeptide (TPR) repeat protein
MRLFFKYASSPTRWALAIFFWCFPSVTFAQPDSDLLQRLQFADAGEAARIERRLEQIWSRSGSASIDIMLKRGIDALEVEQFVAAIEHLTAVIDHAPQFAEGWHWRAQAYFSVNLLGPAVADLERCLALNPNHFGALRDLAGIFEQLRMPARALEVYQAFLTIHP